MKLKQFGTTKKQNRGYRCLEINLDTNSLNINPKLAVDFNKRDRIPFRFDNECVASILQPDSMGFAFLLYALGSLYVPFTFQMLGEIIVKEAYFTNKMGSGLTEAAPSNIFTLETKFKVFESFFYIHLNEML